MIIKHGISLISIIPIRKEASEQSEMVSQLLFGETYHIIERNEKWTFIKCDYDHYEGWIDSKMITNLSEDAYQELLKKPTTTLNQLAEVSLNNKQIRLVPGSTLYQSKPDESYELAGYRIENCSFNNDLNDIQKISKYFLNSPYLWGGKSLFGIDCSGYTQIVFKIYGIKIPRDASQQVLLGETVNFIDEVKKGDLAFFDNDEEIITHVGIILNSKQIIHASGFVRIDKIDHQGIYNEDLNRYTHKLRVIKRIIQ